MRTTYLTPKEIRIIQLICKQYTAKDIATKMGLSYRTVEGYRLIIQKKIGAKNVVGISLYAVKNKLISV